MTREDYEFRLMLHIVCVIINIGCLIGFALAGFWFVAGWCASALCLSLYCVYMNYRILKGFK